MGESVPTPLLQLLGEIKRVLDRLVKGISEYQEAQETQKEKERHAELKTVVRLPPEITSYYEREQRDYPVRNSHETVRRRVEYVAVGAAIVLAILTLCTLYTLNGQLRQARRANDDLEKQFSEQQRPWVDTGEIEVKNPIFLVYPTNPIQARTQIDFTIDVPIKNVGSSPALHVEMGLVGTMTEQIAAPQTGPQTMETMMGSACGQADKIANAAGQVLFPNSPTTPLEWPVNMMVPFIQVNEVHRVWVAVCLAYSGTTPDQKPHHTKVWLACWPTNGQPTEIRRTTQPVKIIYYSLPIARWGVVKTEAD
jgi:hypothetical protein